jgi:uncharacterized protein YegP (UPF0339 family)
MSDCSLRKYQDVNKWWRAKWIASNGKILAKTTRKYKTKKDLVSDLSTTIPYTVTAEIYKDKSKDYRWRWPAKATGRSIIVSSEGYRGKNDCAQGSEIALDETVTQSYFLIGKIYDR